MLKLWSTNTADQATPKAERKNPFDSIAPSTAVTGQGTGSSASHNPMNGSFTSSGARTPTTPGFPQTPGGTLHHHHLLHGDSSSLRGSANPTTQLSLEPAQINMKPPPLGRNGTAMAVPTLGTTTPTMSAAAPATLAAGASPPSMEPGATRTEGSPPPAVALEGQSRGQIHVKVIAARGLNVRSIQSKPYVVVQFENNEFVSRDPISDHEKEVKGTPQPLSRNNSSTALATLANVAGSGLTRAFEKARLPPLGLADKQLNPWHSMMSPHNPQWKHEVSFDVISDQSRMTFNIYDRHENAVGFLGFLEMKPVLIHDHTLDDWYKLQAREGEPVSGEIRVQVTYEQFKTKRVLGPRDFEFLKLIGRGTFGRVFQVRKKDTRRIYAMKVLSKKEIIAKKEVAHTIGERKILQTSLDCPFLVGLKFSFQTATELYLITDFKSGGELFWHLSKEQKFSEERARFYIAELVLALEHLHKYDIVYRDLKPENILLDATGHVALCDFGLSKPDLGSGQLTNTFCGTTEYLAPEVLLDDSGYSKLVDFWSLGVLLFEMCCGWSPFYAEDTQTMYRNICFGKIRFPRGVIGEDGKQFVKGLLNRNPRHRLGATRDADELKEHPFFTGIDWRLLALKQITPPFKPAVESDESTANFDPEFTEADLREQGIDFDEPDEEDVDNAFASLTMSTPGLIGSEASTATTVSTVKTPDVGHGMEIGKTKGAKSSKGAGGKDASSPITSSVQENFRGFTYMGESMIGQAAGMLGEDREVDKNWTGDAPGEVLGEEGEMVKSPEDSDWEDDDDVMQMKGRQHRSGSELIMD